MKKDVKVDTNFCAEFLKIVRAKYGKSFDFEECTIKRGSDCDVVTFQREYTATAPAVSVRREAK